MTVIPSQRNRTTSRQGRSGLLPGLALMCLLTPFATFAAEPTAEDLEFFEKQVRPLLVQQCFKCHSEQEKQRGGLVLDQREAILTGGDNGPAVEPGKPDDSLLIRAIRYDDVDLRMPPKGKLRDEEIAVLTKWVERGAPWPVAAEQPTTTAKEGAFDLAERAKFWSFQPLSNPQPPAVSDKSWPVDAVDQFILAQLEAHQLSPGPVADKRTWLRRVTFDLTGLPPTPAELDDFLADDRPDAHSRVVDRLLASVHYAERWARHWLDLVRYAETYGHEFDFEIPHAPAYRDYVIRAFQQDLPYNQFVVEHVAGDLLAEPRRHPVERFNESIIGTGFWWLGEAKHSPVDVRAEEMNRIDNQLDVFGKTFLGLTIGCARCHDHKFDAISARDYYALAGYIRSSHQQSAFIDDPAQWQPRLEKLTAAQAARQAARGTVLQAAKRPWIEQSTKFLLAARDVPDWNAATEVEAAAKKHAVDPAVLQSLIDELKAATDPAHPLFAVQALLRTPENEFPSQRQKLRQAISERQQAVAAMGKQAEAGQPYDLATLELAQLPAGWRITGQAYGLPLSAEQRLQGMVLGLPTPVGGALHSGHLSRRLRGILRSPDFTLDRQRVWIKTTGLEARVRLVIDEFHLIQNPIYGGLAIGAGKPDQFTWQEFNVSMWQGHRAYLELIDDTDGWVALERVTLSDGGPPPERVHPFVLATLDDRSGESAEAVTQWFQRQLQAASRALSGTQADAAPTVAVSGLAHWLAQTDWTGKFDAGLQALSPEARQSVDRSQADFAALEGDLPLPRRALAMQDGTADDEFLLIRGNHKTLGEVVPRRFLEAFHGAQADVYQDSGRLQLAREMVDPRRNPLVVRVIVNRVWQHHFGTGLVKSPDDFGKMGQLPTHPELLDYLAQEFIRGGWSLKQLHRRIVLTSTYRMSSHLDPQVEAKDPTNQWLHRMPIKRLEAEAIRDSILAVSGRLNRQAFGAPVVPYLTPFMQGRGRPGSSGPLDGDGRRSIYLNVRRNFLSPMLLAFDYPIPFNTIGRRTVSNVPAQALSLMNNQFVLQQAQLWGESLQKATDRTPEQRVSLMYVTALGRPPEPEELQQALEFITGQAQLYPPQEQGRAWGDLAHVLFNTKEFIFIR